MAVVQERLCKMQAFLGMTQLTRQPGVMVIQWEKCGT